MRRGKFVGKSRKPLFLLLSSLLGLTFGAFVVLPAQAAANGTIEVCKSDAHGMAGTVFQFTLNGGAPFGVAGGACSGPMVAPGGQNTVVELPTAGYQVARIKANHKQSQDLATGTVVVKVKANSTAANETLVTYVNKRDPATGLKVCKIAGSPDLVGDLFSFTENGGPAFSVKAGAPSANCGPVTKYPLDTVVHVAELPTNGTEVSSISVSDNRGSNTNTAAGTVDATIGAGVTVVTYTNIVQPIKQYGYIEVCKYAADSFVHGSFSFTITAPGYTDGESVAVGQCTGPLKVPAGNVNVAEASQAPYYVSDISATPSNRLVTRNLANGTSTVVVPVGDSSTETVVAYTNSTTTGQYKVCKTLSANSAALAGQTFNFTVQDASGSHTDYVTAGAAGTTACVIDPNSVPVGSTVQVAEQSVPSVQVVGVGVSPTNRDAGSYGATAKMTIGSGITTATFTNMAFGTVEICKYAADASTATQTFDFVVNGTIPVSVHAGLCSQGIAVPAGTATVQEVAKANFHLVNVEANSGRLLSGSTDDPATVAVPYGGVENETVVAFTNAVDHAVFKICKVSSEPSLQGVAFDFAYKIDGLSPHTVSLTPGQCSTLIGPIPVVDPNGAGIPVSVAEAPVATVAVSNIAVDNGTVTAQTANTVTFNVRSQVTQVTFTNVRTLPPTNVLRY